MAIATADAAQDRPPAIGATSANVEKLHRNLHSFRMGTMTITEASRAGLSSLIASAEAGIDVPLSRHGRVVAEAVSADEISSLRRDRDTLRDAALVMARFATDKGERDDASPASLRGSTH